MAKTKRKIQLPQGYLSYSAREMWLSDREKFIKIYFDRKDEYRTSNKGQEYGKVVATALEKGVDTGDVLTDSAMLLLPKYDIADQEIRAILSIKEGDIEILGRPDTLDSKTFAFREYKTGKHPWTEKKAQAHPQMKFYAMLIYLKHKKIITEAWLDWIETQDTPKGIAPTGRVESFRVKISLSDILKEMTLTAQVAKEIEIAYASHIPAPEIPF